MIKADASLARKQLEVLGHSHLGYTEFRRPSNDFKGEFFYEGDPISEYLDEHANRTLYVGINPRKNKLSGLAKDVLTLNAIVVDIDPVRPKDAPSTDSQHQEAIEQGRRIHAKFPGSVLVDSGSGCHVYIPLDPIKVTDVNEVTTALQAFSYEVKKEFQTKTLKVDSIYDLPRIIRVWGSWNEKSNRLCKPLSGLDTYKRTQFDLAKYKQVAVNNISSSAVAPEFINRFEKLLRVNEKVKNIFNGLTNTDRSFVDFELTKFCVGAKFSDEEIVEIRKRSPVSKSEDRKDGWILEDVRRIRRKLVDESGVKRLDSSFLKTLEERKPGIMTGFPVLDSKLAGLRNGQITIISAVQGHGKTTFATQIAGYLAKNGKKVLYFPTESSAPNIFDKVMSRECAINLKTFQFGNFTKAELEALTKKAKDLENLPLFIVEDHGLTLEVVENKIKELVPDAVFIDYIQGMDYKEGGNALELGRTITEFKRMCHEYNVPFVIMSQVSGENGGSLYGSRKLEHMGDYIIKLETLDEFAHPVPVNAYINKAKYGETGIVKFHFNRSVCDFKEKNPQ